MGRVLKGSRAWRRLLAVRRARLRLDLTASLPCAGSGPDSRRRVAAVARSPLPGRTGADHRRQSGGRNVNDRRLIEEELPLQEVNAASSREKSLRHGHISTMHLWW